MEELEMQQDEKILQSVSDEYLQKKKRKKNIIYTTILSVLLAIATIIIVMSSITVGLKPAFIGNPTSYTIYINGSEKKYIDETYEKYDEFYKIYSQSFNVSYLSALFTGKLGGYEIEETLDNFYSKANEKTGISSTLSSALGSNYVKLEFASERPVKKANGEVYTSKWNTNCQLVFDDVYFTINSTNQDNDLTFYFGTKGAGAGYTITKISIRANTSALYEFATEN